MTLNNTRFISDFRNQLTTHFVSQQQAREDGLDLADNQADLLAMHIISARKERGWTRSYCAQKANIASSTLLSLEKGLILTSEIEPNWCHRLANLFGEDIAIYEEVLDRELPANLSYSYYVRLYERWAIHFFSSKSKFYLLFSSMWFTLMGWLINAFYKGQIGFTNGPIIISIQPFVSSELTLWITAVSSLLATLWIIILKGESLYNWIQQKKNLLLPVAIACLILLLTQNYLFGIPNNFQCQFEAQILLCRSEYITGQVIFLVCIFAFCMAITALIFKFSRHLVRLLNNLQAQRQLVYLSLMLSFLMPLLFFNNNHVNALMPPHGSIELTSTEQQISLIEMPSYQQLSPAENKVLLKKIWHSEQASQLRHQIEIQKDNTFFSLIQFSITLSLYGLIGIAVCRKGKFLSSFSKK